MDAPTVSISLPVYNGENFIQEAIESLLAQDYDDFELVITDNQSTDRTEDICRDYAGRDRRIRYSRNGTNLGAGGNFNRGFELARGKYFKWAAHDDLISSSFLRRGVLHLEAEPDASLVYGPLVPIDELGRRLPVDEGGDRFHRRANRVVPDMRGLDAATRFRRMLAFGSSDNAIFGLIRRSALEGGSLHRPYYGSDIGLLCELALRGRFIHDPEMVVYNRDHSARSVRIKTKESRTQWQDPTRAGRLALEHWPRFLHHIEIARGHSEQAPTYRTIPYAIIWGLSPLRLSWLLLEAIGVVSPGLRKSLSTIGRDFRQRIMHAYHGTRP